MQDTKIDDGISVLIKHKWKIMVALLILIISAMFIYVILPLLDGIIMGIVLAYIARPMKRFIERYSKGASPYVATLAIVLPIFLIIGFGFIEIFNDVIWAINNQDYVLGICLNLLDKLNAPEFARERIKDILLNFTTYLFPALKEYLTISIVVDMGKTVAMLILNTFLAVLICFYLLMDGERLIEKITDIIPEEVESFSVRFINHFDNILSAIFIGNTYSAIAVGVLSVIVFWAFGLSNVLALSTIMLLAAIIPLLTGWMVVIVLALFRYFEMGSQSAIVFFVVCLVVIILPPEFLVRPYLINTKSDIHPMLIILAFLGGGMVGGIAGFFIAPILLGAIMAAYRAGADVRRIQILESGDRSKIQE
ncbi:MAG: AI-2E family transporter [Candidatus Methanoperedens sp.]|nr:AI-2E family transporter [Candidatus Methanoperedens sp.]